MHTMVNKNVLQKEGKFTLDSFTCMIYVLKSPKWGKWQRNTCTCFIFTNHKKVNKNSWLQATPFTTNSYHNSFIYILIPSHNSVHFLIPSHNSIHLLIPSYNSDNFHIPSPYLVHYLSIFPNMLPNFPAAPCWNCLIIPCKPCIPPTMDTQTSQHTYRSRSYCKYMYLNLNIHHLYQYTSQSLVSIMCSSKCKCIYICLYI